MNKDKLKEYWLSEEAIAHIHGWDFSHIHDRYEEEQNLPWNYEKIIRTYLKGSDRLLDIDTGGGEFLLSLGHPFSKTSATEGYPPNVALCEETLLPLGIDFRPTEHVKHMPFPDHHFDIIINRHGDYDISELYRILKPKGIFITQQVGNLNDRELVELLLPDTPQAFPNANFEFQSELFRNHGFKILQSNEAFSPIRFYDIGALVWFARIIEWEFPGFSVDKCFSQLMHAQEILENQGFVEGTTHRYLIVAQK